MPPKGKPRHSSPINKPSRSTRVAGKKPRATDPLPKPKRKQDESDDEGEESTDRNEKANKKRRKDHEGNKTALEDEEGEDGEESEADTSRDTQEGLQEIFKELSSKFQSKTSRRSSNKAKGENKDLKKVDKVHDDLLNTMGIDDQPAAAGHDRLEHPPEVAANFHDRLNTLIEQDDESASKLSDLIARRTTHWYTIYDAYIDLNDNYQKSIITDLDKAVTLFEKRPKNIESTIKDYTKLQRETMKEDEEKIKSMLDDKNLVHQWQIFMASMLKRP